MARGTVLDPSRASVSAQIGSAAILSFPDGTIVAAELVKNEELAELVAPSKPPPGASQPDNLMGVAWNRKDGAVDLLTPSADDARTLPVAFTSENVRKHTFASAVGLTAYVQRSPILS